MQERLRLAGASEPLFHPAAIEAVYRYSKGIPRLINLLGEHSMMGAYVEQLKPVPAYVVESVARDFELDTAPIPLMREMERGMNNSPVARDLSGDGHFISVKTRGHSA